MLGYFRSFFKPVVKQTNDTIILWIRGAKFIGTNWEEIRQQVQAYSEFLRRQLNNDTGNALRMQGAGNIHGRWNVGLVMMRNTAKTLLACESLIAGSDKPGATQGQ
ncbi:MAG: hypothetical protein PHC60_04620 [Heliobacteriaceae bacterium]|nr:hypothetical protein [Heliobacteriaceae bacterium]